MLQKHCNSGASCGKLPQLSEFFDLHAKVCDCGFFYQLVVINSWSHYDTTRVT